MNLLMESRENWLQPKDVADVDALFLRAMRFNAPVAQRAFMPAAGLGHRTAPVVPQQTGSSISLLKEMSSLNKIPAEHLQEKTGTIRILMEATPPMELHQDLQGLHHPETERSIRTLNLNVPIAFYQWILWMNHVHSVATSLQEETN